MYQGHKNKRKSSPTKAGPDCLTNSPCQYLKNVWGTVWRICLLILGCKGLKDQWSKCTMWRNNMSQLTEV